MNLKNLLCERADGVATVSINRPDKLNALNQATLAELSWLITDLDNDSNTRVIVITGAGPKAFVAGADITEINGLSSTKAHQFSREGQALMQRIEQLSKPVIAMINGFALGGGMELALACHLRIASDSARLGLPEIKLGILPGFGGTQRLTRLVGRTQALGLILSGEPIDAQRAHALGLINEIAPPEDLAQTTQAWATRLANAAPHAVAGILESVVVGQETHLEAGLALETARFAICCATEDMQEGTSAFMEKRAPQFTGN